MRRSLLDKKPNPAHLALARLEKSIQKVWRKCKSSDTEY